MLSFDSIRQLLAYAADHCGLQLLETAELRERISAALTESGRWEKRQCPLKAPLVVWFVLMMALHRSLSIAVLVKQLLATYRLELPEVSLRDITPEAMIHARKRLGVEPLKLVFEKGASMVVPDPSFHGLRVWGTDGCAMSVPDTKENEEHFGRPKASRGSTAFPKLHFVALVDATTRRIRDIVVGRYNQREREAAVELLPSLGKGDVLLCDRGFAGVWFFERCVKVHKVEVLSRIAKSWKPRVLKKLGAGDYLVEVTGAVPKQFRRKSSRKAKRGSATATMTMRMIVCRIGNSEQVRFLTSLLDQDVYPARELVELYHARWECELAYDEIKTHLAAVTGGTVDLPFRSQAPNGVLQEFYALLSLYNLIRELMVDAAYLLRRISS
jgi:hypothetical protein